MEPGDILTEAQARARLKEAEDDQCRRELEWFRNTLKGAEWLHRLELERAGEDTRYWRRTALFAFLGWLPTAIALGIELLR